MAGLRSLRLLIRRILSSTVFHLLGTCVLLFLFFHWVIVFNHDSDSDIASPLAARPTTRLDDKQVDWSKLYYVQYVTTPENLCSSLMIWSKIEQIGSRAQRLMLYPSDWDLEEKDGNEYTPVARLLQQAKKNYYVKLRPLDALVQNDTAAREMWSGPYTKLLGFNLTEFDRVLAIDPASIVRQNLDELFLYPAAPLAMPYIYFGRVNGWHFSTQLTLMTPSTTSFSRVSEAIKGAPATEYDSAILETLFRGQIIKIPQRPFAFLSGEYRRTSHEHYIGNRWPKKWDPDRMLGEARLLHFADDPLPKPWVKASQDLVNRNMPSCRRSEWFGASDCRDREVWSKLYWDYADMRKAVCGTSFEVVPRDGPAIQETEKGRERTFHVD